jgi:hypothetical protein
VPVCLSTVTRALPGAVHGGEVGPPSPAPEAGAVHGLFTGRTLPQITTSAMPKCSRG